MFKFQRWIRLHQGKNVSILTENGTVVMTEKYTFWVWIGFWLNRKFIHVWLYNLGRFIWSPCMTNEFQQHESKLNWQEANEEIRSDRLQKIISLGTTLRESWQKIEAQKNIYAPFRLETNLDLSHSHHHPPLTLISISIQSAPPPRPRNSRVLKREVRYITRVLCGCVIRVPCFPPY